MNLKTISSAAVTCTITLGLVLGAPAGAHAAVSAKDTVSEADIVKAVPEIAGGSFTTEKGKVIGTPGKTCGATVEQKVKSAVTIAGTSTVGFPTAAASASELSSESKAKKYLAAYTKFVKNCASFTEPSTGAVVTMQKASAPKLGQGSVAAVQTIAIGGFNTYSASVVVRVGKRIASVVVIDDAAVSSAQINALAKAAAKKLK